MQQQQSHREMIRNCQDIDQLKGMLVNAIARMDCMDMKEIILKIRKDESLRVIAGPETPLHCMIKKSSLVKKDLSKHLIHEQRQIFYVVVMAFGLLGNSLKYIVDDGNNTLLHWAVYARHIPLVEMLLATDPPLDFRNGRNATPVEAVITRPDLHIFRLLLGRGAPFHHFIGSFTKKFAEDVEKIKELPRFHELAKSIHSKLSLDFDEARFRAFNNCFDMEEKDTPVMTLPVRKGSLKPKKIEFGVQQLHKKACCIRHLLVTFAVKLMEGTQQFVVLNEPVPLAKRPILNNQLLPDLAAKQGDLGLPAGYFWYARPTKENTLELVLEPNNLDFTLIACQFLRYRVDCVRPDCSCDPENGVGFWQ